MVHVLGVNGLTPVVTREVAFCCIWIENSWALVHHYKTIYGMETVPIVLKVDFETGDEHVIGGFTDLKEYIDQGLHEEGDKEAE